MAAQTELQVVVTAVNEAKETVRDVSKDLKEMFNEVKTHGKESTAVFKGMEEALHGIEGVIRKIVGLGGLAILWREIKELADVPVRLAEMAGRIDDLAQGMKAVGVNAGFSAPQIESARKEIEKLGYTAEATVQSLTKLLVEGVSPGKATQLAEVAKRIAVVTAHSQDEVLRDVTYAVSRGTTRLLQVKYGLGLDAQLEFQKKQQELGRKLYEDERRTTIADSLITKGGSQYALDPNRVKTSTEVQDDFNTSITKSKELIGKELVPSVHALTEAMTQLLDLANSKGAASALGKFFANVPKYILRAGAPLVGIAGAFLPGSSHGPAAITSSSQRDVRLADNVGQAERDRIQQERDLQDKKDLRAKVKAEQDIIVDAAKTEESIAKIKNTALDEIEKQRFDHGRVDIANYYAGTEQRIEDNYKFQRTTAQKTLDAAAKDFESVKNITGYDPAKAGKTPPPAEYSQAQAAVAKAKAALGVVDAQHVADLTKNEIAYAEEIIKTTRALEDQADTQKQAADTHDVEAAIEALNHKYERLRETLHDVNGVLTDQQKAFDINQKIYEVHNKTITDTVALNQGLIDLQRAGNDLLLKQGVITTVEGQNRNNQLISNEVELRRAAINALNEEIKAGELSNTNTEAAQLAVIGYAKEILGLQLQIKTTAEELRNAFSGELADGIKNLILGTKNLKESLADLAKAFAETVTGKAAQQLAEKGVQLIIENTGGEGGIFASLGKILGDRGSEINPMVVTLAAKDRAIAAQGNDGLFSGVGDWWSSLGAGSEAEAVAAGIAPAMAAGGSIAGPSHAGGGVNINAEGGEYVVNKRQSAKWAGLLHSINSGNIDSVMSSNKRVYADGGMVGDPSHGGVNVTVNTNGEDSMDKAKADRLGRLVQAAAAKEIARQQRPGGILFGGR